MKNAQPTITVTFPRWGAVAFRVEGCEGGGEEDDVYGSWYDEYVGWRLSQVGGNATFSKVVLRWGPRTSLKKVIFDSMKFLLDRYDYDTK